MKEIISCLKNRIDDLMKTDKQIVVAIDGNCTAGKTTLAAVLKNEYDCNVFHMDDFFSGLSSGQLSGTRNPEEMWTMNGFTKKF